MDDWYGIGLAAGVGVSFGVLLAAILAATRVGLAAAVVLAVAAGAGVLYLVDPASSDVAEAIAAGAGAVIGALSTSPLLRGTLRRGGTRGATGMLLGAIAVALGALALIPAVGFLEAIAVPALAARLRERAPERYAGLRTLARD